MIVPTLLLSTLVGSSFALSEGHGSQRLNSRHTPSKTLQKRAAGAPVTPSDWPTETQSGAVPSITATNSADPYLKSLSYALNNEGNSYWTTKYTGDLTYYATGSVACGDNYVEETYTAAVSEDMWTAWPGATANPNRHPICGPWTTGRNVLGDVVVQSSEGMMTIGGDGLPNCTGDSQCHVPMTATITNPANGKSVVVQVVDRCGGCAMGDIDVTTTAYAEIADISAGRTHGIQWEWNHMGSSASAPPPPPPPPPPKQTTSAKPPASTPNPPSGSSACKGVANWSAGTTYVGGQTAIYNDELWKANWWSLGDVPGVSQQGEWTMLNHC